jgi:hypothetical protein
MEKKKGIQITLVISTMVFFIFIVAIFFFVPGPEELEKKFNIDFPSSIPDLRIIVSICALSFYLRALVLIYVNWKKTTDKHVEESELEMNEPLNPH